MKRWVEDLFRLASRKRSYTVLMHDSSDLAWVHPGKRLAFITTSLPGVPLGVRCDPLHEDLRRAALLRALAVHEAGHVRHSGPKPEALALGWVWNALEDERMERLMAREFPEVDAAFTLMGDVVAEEQRPGWDGSVLEGCLFWRFTHDRPEAERWRPAPEHAEVWMDVRPLVEASWAARNSEEVRWIARMILALVNAEQSEAKSTPQEPPTAGEGQDRNGPGGTQDQDGADRPDPDTQKGTHQVQAGEGGEAQDPQDEASTDAPGDQDGALNAREAQVIERYADLTSASGAGQEAGDEDGAGSGCSAPGETTPTVLPAPPSVDHAGGARLARGVERFARDLAPLIRPPGKPARTHAHNTRGRYRFDREVRGSERVFDQRLGASRPQAFTLDVLVDVSSSMRGARLDAARAGALMVLRAASLVQGVVRVTSFHTLPQEVVPAGMPYEAAAARLAELTALGSTCLNPALRQVLLRPLGRAGDVHVVVIVCDGELTDEDHAACRSLVEVGRAGQKRFVPLLIGEGADDADGWRATFGSAVPCRDVATLARQLKAVLTAMRARG